MSDDEQRQKSLVDHLAPVMLYRQTREALRERLDDEQ